MKPPAEWKRTPAPHLQIIDEDAWEAAGGRKRAERAFTPREIMARRQGVFSGLLKCGCCGASYTSFSKTRLVCLAHREQGPAVCGNERRPLQAMFERRILHALRTRLASPEGAEVYMRAYADELARGTKQIASRRQPLEQKLGELQRRTRRFAEAVFDGRTVTQAERALALEQEVEIRRIEAELAEINAEPPALAIHPAAPAYYAQKIGALQAALGAMDRDLDAARPLIDAVRGLILRVDITPDEAAEDGFAIAMVGNLARFMHAPTSCRRC